MEAIPHCVRSRSESCYLPYAIRFYLPKGRAAIRCGPVEAHPPTETPARGRPCRQSLTTSRGPSPMSPRNESSECVDFGHSEAHDI
jgi:hypothetical protein